MIKVGLTGNRFSGKDTVCDLFKEVGIPIFYADIILKYIINHDFLTLERIKNRVGAHVFVPPFVEAKAVKTKEDFDKILDCVEFELMNLYNKFNKKNSHSIYTIFHSAILFERGWDRINMDYSINVFCPRNIRLARSRMEIEKARLLFKNELEDFEKNNAASFTIGNYDNHDLKSQIMTIDQKIINDFLRKEQTTMRGDRSVKNILS